MKKHFPLSPPIDLIEKQLFGVTEGLIEAVQRGETSSNIADVVKRSVEWEEYQVDLDEEKLRDHTVGIDISPTNIPNHIQDFIKRRVAASSLHSLSPPAAGQIVSVEEIITPKIGQLDAVMLTPLYVLLDAQSETSNIWHGWLVSAETDYAGWWDFVLQEQDAPFDPEAAMVQVWNPVRLYLPMLKRVVGRLTPFRLQTVRALVADFLLTTPPADIPAWPGRVASRTTSSGLTVTTGGPLGNISDDRHRYQSIYFEAAEAIREPARLAIIALSKIPENKVGALLNRLVVAAGKIAEVLIPEPRVAIAMSGEEKSEAPDLYWRNIARLRIVELTDEGHGRMEITAIGTESLIVEIRNGSQVEEHINIASAGVDIVAWDNSSTELILVSANGQKLNLPLRVIE